MQSRRVPVDTDVRNATAWANELGAELERLRDADRFDRDICAETAGQLHDLGSGRCAAGVVDRHVGAELACASSRESSMSIATMCAGV